MKLHSHHSTRRPDAAFAKQSGLSILEVLIALAVLAIGLAGLAVMHMNSLKYAHSAYYRSIASAAALDAATLTVTLPDGIELAGFPGQREITWQTSLVEGKNFLPLELIALSSVGGEVLARLEHDDRDRTFRLRVEVS